MAERDDPMMFADGFLEQLAEMEAKDPEAAKAAREMLANIRQAHTAWLAGQYPSFEDAVEAITGQRPERIPEEDSDIERDD